MSLNKFDIIKKLGADKIIISSDIKQIKEAKESIEFIV